MFYHFLYRFSDSFTAFNVFRYITFRSIIAFVVAALISIVFGGWFIKLMQKKQFGQVIRRDGPESHFKKKGTPTMGGVFIIFSIMMALFISGNFSSTPFLICLFVMISYFLLGLRDDYLKVIEKDTKGVSARGKLAWQFSTALIASIWAVNSGVISTELHIPLLKNVSFDLGILFPIFTSIVIVGSSNAVNLTDGLDGLAIGPIMTSATSLGVLTYAAGHKEIADYLLIPHIAGIGEITVLCLAFIGAGVGFLWYNSYPAQIFMGDVGSLSLGGVLGTIAVLSKNELLFVLIGGIFVVEALSVIIQVASFKIRGKRVFKMAPIHHHFELLGWPEPKVIVRFWIVSLILALISIATLKLR